MPLVKRLVKGSPLTYAEADGNLTYLDNKVTGSVGLIPVFDSVNTVTGSNVISQLGSNVIIDGGLTIYGDLTARQYIVSSSVSHFTESFSSGSTRFGDTITDTHVFTGSVYITGSQTLDGFLSSSDGAYFTNDITVTHMTIGHGPGQNNTNTAIGWITMPVLASGLRNTIVGASSGYLLQSGSDNTAFGNNALLALTSGSYNTAIGQNAGALASGSGNVFLGHQAGQQQTSGDNKLWIANSNTLTPLIKGDFSTGLLQFNTSEGTQITGSLNVSNAVTASFFKGDGSGLTNLPGSSAQSFIASEFATASVSPIATRVFSIIVSGSSCGFIDPNFGNASYGDTTLKTSTSGSSNSAFGAGALFSNTTGESNTAIGNFTLPQNTTGSYNTAIGQGAGFSNVTGVGNVFLGYQAGANETLSNKLYIANTSSSTPLIKGDFSSQLLQLNTSAGGTQITGSLRVSQGINAGAIIGTSLSATTGSLSVNYNNRSSFTIDPFFKYISFADYNDLFGNSLTIYLSGSNSNKEIYLQTGNKGLSISNKLKVLPSGVQVTGSFLVTGSSVFSGSATGIVNSLSISSNTASLDLSKGNFFTLQLVGGADTYINPSNIQSGQTATILISTVGSGTVSFPNTVLQASGSSYVPTATTGKDIITLVSFDSINLYLANVKNLV